MDGVSMSFLIIMVKFLVTKDIFPAGLVVKNLPYNAGDVGSIPGQGTNIPHALGSYIISLHTATTESTCHSKDPIFHNQDPM